MVDRTEQIVDDTATMYAPNTPSRDAVGRIRSSRTSVRWMSSHALPANTLPMIPLLGPIDGASEDVANFIRRVQRYGGEGTYVIVGASNPDGLHTARFDIDEDAVGIGVDILAAAIRDLV